MLLVLSISLCMEWSGCNWYCLSRYVLVQGVFRVSTGINRVTKVASQTHQFPIGVALFLCNTQFLCITHFRCNGIPPVKDVVGGLSPMVRRRDGLNGLA